MKIIRLQIPGNFLEHIGFADLFQHLEFIEILNAFQYDQNHFFALQRIRFKPNIIKDLNNYIKKKFNPQSFQLLNQTSNEIICIMNQKKTSGFFPIVDSGPWAFLFPIHVSQDVLLINLISQNEYVNKLFDVISSFTKNYKIIGMTDLDKINEVDQTIWRSAIPFPKFTKRQQEVASFAAKKGFFKTPKKIRATQIADHFGISESAVNRLIKSARNLAMEYFFGT
ncbi:MAG: helix-turn-helix domain-containing protein, partial [Promethearchaeota archaeon]